LPATAFHPAQFNSLLFSQDIGTLTVWWKNSVKRLLTEVMKLRKRFDAAGSQDFADFCAVEHLHRRCFSSEIYTEQFFQLTLLGFVVLLL